MKISILFLLFFSFQFSGFAQPSFTTPDTVCVGTVVPITNTSVGASSYFWNFCVANINNAPTGVNMGNVESKLSAPVYIDYVVDNGNYYGFMTNNWPGGLLRLNFGNSLLNTPTITDLGNVGGIIPNNTEGVQIVKNENKWYVIVVGGDPVGGTSSRIVKIELGTNIANNSPVGTNWGNIGNMLYPHDLYVFEDNGQWYGLTVNTDNNTITRFHFTSSFSNTPTAVNLGNIGNLDGPTGIFAMKENGSWYAFATNYKSSTLTRLNFGNSLLNVPTGVNLGNIGGNFHQVWDIHILQFCGKVLGYAINAQSGYSDIVKLDFGNSITNTPTTESFGNIGNLNFPHAISKIFRVGADLYSFIPSVANNSLSRIRFTGCNNSSIPNSNLQNPPPVTYNIPGTYNIFLNINDGLSTQASTCRPVVVIPPPQKSPTQIYSACAGQPKKIGSSKKPATYLWNTGATTDSIIVTAPGTYWIESTRFGCTVRDSIIINALPSLLNFSYSQDLCDPKKIQFQSGLSNNSTISWNFGDGQENSGNASPNITYLNYGAYNVKLIAENSNGCMDSIQKTITVSAAFSPSLISNGDTSICPGDSVLITKAGNLINECWTVSQGALPVNNYVYPTVTTTYHLNSQVPGSNLVVNGNFENGVSGFTSQYIYNSSSGFSAGVYNVGSSITAWHPSMANCQDHTTGSGKMLMVNGADQTNVNVWAQTITIQPNTNYVFYTWIQHITSVNPAQLRFSINGNTIGNTFNANSQSCLWEQFYTTWNSGNSTSAQISIVNMNSSFSGNDFALDDIFFGTITPQTDSFTVFIGGVCDSVKIIGPQMICSLSDTVSYNIYRENCNQALTVTVDPNYAEVISTSQNLVKIVYKQEGSTAIKIQLNSSCINVSDSLSVDIKLSPASIDLGPDLTICSDTSFLLKAGTGFASYLWQNVPADSNFLVNSPGIYEVSALNYCGESFTDNFVYTRVLPGNFTVSPLTATVCAGDSVSFLASGGDEYLWSPSANFSQPFSGATKAYVDVTQQFSVFIKDSYCDRDTTILIPVNATDKADIEITKTNDVNCSIDSAVLTVSGGQNYTWTTSPYITRDVNGQVTVKPPVTTTFYVNGVNSLGCSGEDSITVEFSKTGNEQLFMPNAFTPNNDGLNDRYKAAFIGPAKSFEFRIYNRWGELVFRSNSPDKGWDGTYKGKLQPGDVFVYYITAEGGCDGKFVQKGTFVLIR